ncbi:MAG: HD domain-containing protein, partial [Pseudomonadota bacterium]
MNIKELTGSGILKSAYSASDELGISIFLVGGTIRSLLLSSRIGKDFDFALQRNVEEAAKSFAKRVGGSFFCLDERRGHYRVTIKGMTGATETDFSMLRGAEITKDLRERDFTINAMAIDLRDLFQRGEIRIIDPLDGLSDIEKRIIRVCSSSVFDEDPLRLLRAIRISGATNFMIEDRTVKLIREKKELLTDCSWERIRDELFQILDVPHVSKSIAELDSLGLLNVILPELSSWKNEDQGEHHDYNLLDHALKTVEFTEAILSNLSDYFLDYASPLKVHFDEVLEGTITRNSLVKLIALLHDSGKIRTKSYRGQKVHFLGHDRVGEAINEAIAKRLKLSQKASRIIMKLTRNHMRILNLSMSTKISRRAKYHFFRDLGIDGPDCIILSLADGLATRRDTTSEQTTAVLAAALDLLRYYFEDRHKVPEKPLLNGKEIM